MMQQTVYVFPGQGSQQRGMGEQLFPLFPDLLEQAEQCLGYSLRELCLHDPQQVLQQTEYTQPALYTVSCLQYLQRRAQGGPPPDWLAGHSLGEYCALFAAGAFDFLTGLRLVQRRGQIMSRAPQGAMLAVLELEVEKIQNILARHGGQGIDLANINSGRQVILSGLRADIQAPDLHAALTSFGAKLIPLRVSAAFHSRYMRAAAQEYAQFLQEFTFHTLQLPVLANYNARPYPRQGYTDLMALQIDHPVQWYETISWLLQQGAQHFEEIGPGTVLRKLCDNIRREPMLMNAPAAPALPSSLPSPPPSAAVLNVAHGVQTVPHPGSGRGAAAENGPQRVFMFAGQGSQYFGMARELYASEPQFRAQMQACEQIWRRGRRSGEQQSFLHLIEALPAPGQVCDDLEVTHPALFAIGYSLAQTLIAAGFAPHAVLGHSLGEYIAATLAGVLTLEQGLDLIAAQVRLVQEERDGAMLSVLAPMQILQQQPQIFAGLTLAGRNFAGNFLLSGRRNAILEARRQLQQAQITAVLLPVQQAFHSAELERFAPGWQRIVHNLPLQAPRLALYSSAYASRLQARDLSADYLWQVGRAEIRFEALMEHAFADSGRWLFVDLSASGSFANFLKHGFGGRHTCLAAINQFGKNRQTYAQLLIALENARGQRAAHVNMTLAGQA